MLPAITKLDPAALASIAMFSAMLKFPASDMLLVKALDKISVWLPVVSAKAMATASLKLTPSLILIVAVSVVLVT